jgi:hypothetical protein
MGFFFLSIVSFYRLLQLFHDVIVTVNNNTNVHPPGQLAQHSSFTMYLLYYLVQYIRKLFYVQIQEIEVFTSGLTGVPHSTFGLLMMRS